MTYQIRYVRNPQTGNFHVNLIGKAQNIVILPRAFVRITGVDPRTVLGCREITAEIAAELGFIVQTVAPTMEVVAV